MANSALDTALNELERVNAIRTRIHLAAKDVIDAKFSTYRARNGRDVGVEDEGGEKCWIVPSDLMSILEGALEAEPSARLVSGWLVEWPGTLDQPVRWWHPERGWTIDASRAIRFARKEDAEAYIERPGGGGAGRMNQAIATEHVWPQ